MIYSLSLSDKEQQYYACLSGRRKTSSNKAKDTDQIQDEIEKSVETGKPITFAYDDELPGGG